jgi:hypothetical protein
MFIKYAYFYVYFFGLFFYLLGSQNVDDFINKIMTNFKVNVIRIKMMVLMKCGYVCVGNIVGIMKMSTELNGSLFLNYIK